MKFKLLGAVDGSVTGSCTYFQFDKTNTKFLVDCGLVQGEPHAPATNAAKFPFAPEELKFVLLTHAHLDHCGLIPRLYKEGFNGQVICTEATAKLAKISLLDAAKYSGSLYTERDVHAINFFHVDNRSDFGFYRFIPIDDELFACFTRSAHILGSVSISLSWKTDSGENRVITMSGDIGNNTKMNPYQSLLAHKQIPPINSNYIVCESTYGERERDSFFKSHQNRINAIREIIEQESLKKNKLVVFPAFSIHRTQEIMLDVAQVLSGEGKNSFGVLQDRPLPDTILCNVKKNLWNKGDQNHIDRLLQAAGSEAQAYWSKLLSEKYINKGTKKEKVRFVLADEGKLSEFIDFICSVKLPTYRSLHIESGMAGKINKVYASELNKRQRYKSDELLQRNRKLTDHFDVATEDEVDQIIETVFDDEVKNQRDLLANHSIGSGLIESYTNNKKLSHKIVISGSGMCDGGPIARHMGELLTNDEACIVLTGFMAKGTAGAALRAIYDKRKLQDQIDTSSNQIEVPLSNGKRIKESLVVANIVDLSAFYSGHADQKDLIEHIMNISESKHTDNIANNVKVFINHGTQTSREVLKEKLLSYDGDTKRDVKSVLLPEKGDKLFDLDIGQYIDEDIEVVSYSNGELSGIHSELTAIRKLLERIVEK